MAAKTASENSFVLTRKNRAMRGGEIQVKVKVAIEAIGFGDILEGIWTKPVNPEYIPGDPYANPSIPTQGEERGLPTAPVEPDGYNIDYRMKTPAQERTATRYDKELDRFNKRVDRIEKGHATYDTISNAVKVLVMSFLDDELSTLVLPQELLNIYLTWDAFKRIAADITSKEGEKVKMNHRAFTMILGESMDALDIRLAHMERSLENTRDPQTENMK